MLEVQNFSKTYKKSKKQAAKNISFSINPGEIVGFIGPNGAGKTTLIKALVGIDKVQEGIITIGGYDIEKNSIEAKNLIGYVQDEVLPINNFTGLDYIKFIKGIYKIDNTKLNLTNIIDSLDMESNIDKPFSSYSFGMKKKLAFIGALSHDPEVLILDEPLTGLDPTSSYNMKELMKEMSNQGKIVFFSSHVLDVVEKVCTRIIIIKEGRIILDDSMNHVNEMKGDRSLERLFIDLIGDEFNGN